LPIATIKVFTGKNKMVQGMTFQKTLGLREVEVKDLKDGLGRVRLLGTIVARHDLPAEDSATIAIDDGTGRASILAPIETPAREKDKAVVVGVVFTASDGTLAVKSESITLLENLPTPGIRERVKSLWDAEFKAKDL